MVAAHPDRAERRQAIDDRVRFRPVADDVTEVPDGVDGSDLGEHGVEGEEVAVDVGDHGDSHPSNLAVCIAYHGRRLRAAGSRG